MSNTPDKRPLGLPLSTVVLVAVAPLAAFVAGSAGLYPSLLDVLLALALGGASIFGVSAGYHRLVTHKAFETKAWVRTLLLLSGGMAWLGGPIEWAAVDRAHHRFADGKYDPHSPAVGERPLLSRVIHAHFGWRLTLNPRVLAPLVRDLEHLRAVDLWCRLMPLLSVLIVPAACGALLGGGLIGAVSSVVWAGLVRAAVVAHGFWLINSLGHLAGEREFDTPDESVSVAWLSGLTGGDSWHNFHHAFPQAARLGLTDPTASLIETLERRGLAWNLHRPAPDDVSAARLKVEAQPTAPQPREPGGPVSLDL